MGNNKQISVCEVWNMDLVKEKLLLGFYRY